MRVQAVDVEDLPVSQQRHYDVVVVDAQVVNARLGNLRRLAGESRYDIARHRKAGNFVGDRSQGRVRSDLKRGLDEVAVEDHVQVLVHRDPGEQPLSDWVFAVAAGVA